jgi:hypothetical protein
LSLGIEQLLDVEIVFDAPSRICSVHSRGPNKAGGRGPNSGMKPGGYNNNMNRGPGMGNSNNMPNNGPGTPVAGPAPARAEGDGAEA